MYVWQTRFWYDGEVGYVKMQDSNKTIFWHMILTKSALDSEKNRMLHQDLAYKKVKYIQELS